MKRFLKEYRTELIAAAMILFGIFLMVERFEIRATLRAAVSRAASAILSVLKRIVLGGGSRLASLSLSGAIGFILILAAVVFIVWRIRYRFQTDKHWESEICPNCSGPITRVHRSLWDRLLGAFFLPEARRYRCMDLKCGWSGLLRRHIHRHRRRSEQVSRAGDS